MCVCVFWASKGKFEEIFLYFYNINNIEITHSILEQISK